MKKHYLVHVSINLVLTEIQKTIWFHQENMPTRYEIYKEIDSHMFDLLSITTFSEEEYYNLEKIHS